MYRTLLTTACIFASASAVKLTEATHSHHLLAEAQNSNAALAEAQVDLAPADAFAWVKDVADSGKWAEAKEQVKALVLGWEAPAELKEVRQFLIDAYKKHEAVVDAALKDFLTALAGGDDATIDAAVAEATAWIKKLWNDTGFAEHRKSLEDFGIDAIIEEAKVWLGHFVLIAKKSDGIFEGKKVQVAALAEHVITAALAAEWAGKVQAWVAGRDLSTLTVADFQEGAKALKDAGVTAADVKAAFAWAQENHPVEAALVADAVKGLLA